jgi:5-methylthioadenosine/S-adenosylhomocysteine deaminase
MSNVVDTILFPAWIIPIIPEGQVLENHALAITDGRISALLPAAQARLLEAKEVLELPGHVVLPGLINMHGHAGMSLLRGYADDFPLMPWLEQHIWPAESQHVSPAFVRDGTDLAIAEMIRAGTTCFSDMYFFPNVVAQQSQLAGMRCQLSFPVFDFATAWGSDADDYISKGLALRDDLKHSELARVVFGPHAPYTVNPVAMQKISMLANELDLPVHIHLHETADEVREAQQATGQRPLASLNEMGLIGPRTQCVHMTELNVDEIELLAAAGAHVIHCPHSNMKLGSGHCPVTALQAAGVNVALGSDGAASNNNLNLIAEMRSAALLAKTGAADATALPAQTALTMATIAGARAMGRQDDLGSIEIGKFADLIAVDFGQPETQPVYNPISQLVYATQASQVTHSWVAGNPLMRDRQLTHMDLPDIIGRAQAWRRTIEEGRNIS